MWPTALMEEESLRESLERTSVPKNAMSLANHQVSQAEQNPSETNRAQDAMDPVESVLCKPEDREEGVKVGTVLLSGTKESINRQSKVEHVGD
jgi:hypothetical protein